MNVVTLAQESPKAEIRCSISVYAHGYVLVATTERGICGVLLGDDKTSLLEDLKKRFPKAKCVDSDHELRKNAAAVVAFIESPEIHWSLPLDIRGTVFQKQVWKALRKIPHGKTATYREIAERIGKRSAVRAVAQACAANPVAVLVPCHRVIRSDGSLSGYRWGLKRKAALLKRERQR